VQDSGDRTSTDLIAYLWSEGSGNKLVIVNLGSGTSSGRIYLSQELLSSSTLRFDDLLNDHAYERQSSDLRHLGLFVQLPGFGAHIFDVKRTQD